MNKDLQNSNPGLSIESAPADQAAILIDYENLYTYFAEKSGLRRPPDEAINDLTVASKKFLRAKRNVKSTSFAAIADFSLLPSQGREIQRRLYLNGVEPHYVPGGIQKNAAEIQLCVEAVDIIQSQDPVDLLVVLTADRAYLPLATYAQHKGIEVVILAFRLPEFAEPHALNRCYVSGHDVLRTYAKSGYGAMRPPASEPVPGLPADRSEPVEYKLITDPVLLQALEMTEEHFGQYNDIFLTPLLRKLSEVMGDRHDPKQLINGLEEAGAVWLERRSGYPYDFTVMILDSDHPNVAEIQSDEPESGREGYHEGRVPHGAASSPTYGPPDAAREHVIRRLGHQH
ncbi:MAG: NYN domain-containing protein [Bacteroidota bacterium]|nr:NYN domain-containing protein [Bacteroidota bacterium]MDE2833252.1 NYN domain-containing protein [Bacteroidota bacterium]MDE2957577.1 NYN domain-containing protein [Bacteroidota bacterium]